MRQKATVSASEHDLKIQNSDTSAIAKRNLEFLALATKQAQQENYSTSSKTDTFRSMLPAQHTFKHRQ